MTTKHNVWLAVTAVGALCPVGIAWAGTHVVYPTGIWPEDMNNVQAAVATDGSVLLKAVNRAGRPTAFNFGPTGDPSRRQVQVEANVEIQGETVKGARTTIQGGLHPLVGVTPVSRRISGIDFIGAQDAAIEIEASRGRLEISGNRISGVVPLLLEVPNFTETEGMIISGDDSGQVNGEIRIWNNRVDLADSTAQFRFGIQVSTVDADVDISGNEVFIAQTPIDGRFVDSLGIAILRCHAKVSITYNSVHVGAHEAVAGIETFGDSEATYRIAGNLVTNESASADGISLNGDMAVSSGFIRGVVEDNVVSMHGGVAGISLLANASGITVRDNFIVGTGLLGIAVSNFYPNDVEANNRLIDNDLRFFEGDVGSIFLDTNTKNTLVKGRCGEVVDLGVGNQLRCQKGN
jgi:hypothetical protein